MGECNQDSADPAGAEWMHERRNMDEEQKREERKEENRCELCHPEILSDMICLDCLKEILRKIYLMRAHQIMFPSDTRGLEILLKRQREVDEMLTSLGKIYLNVVPVKEK